LQIRKKEKGKMAGITRELAKFIAEANYDTIPERVRQEAKRRILDYCGVTLAGSTRPEGKMIVQFVRDLGGKEEATIIGSDFKTSCVNAALCNGTMSHVVELGDWGRMSNTHGGETMGSATFALGERLGLDGKRLILAWVLGYEAAQRVGNATHPALRSRGFHANGCVATFGAAAACSKILGLDTDETEQALGHAGTQSAGLLTFLDEGAMSKRLHTGKGNQSGVIAALLAQKGFTGPRAILESEKGFFRAFTQWPEFKYHPEKVTQNLGSEWWIMNTNIKIHACCGYFPPGLDIIQDFWRDEKLRTEDVENIKLTSYTLSIDGHMDTHPTTIVGATMSYPYCITVVLTTGKCSLNDFTIERLSDKGFMKMVEKIGSKTEFVIEPETDKLIPEKYPATVQIKTRNGKVLEKRVDLPRGFYPENPVEDKELEDKFFDLATMVISHNKAAEILSLIKDLEDLKNIKELVSLLQP
jgi:2-methylcitrate dehydratase PrpD